MSSPCLLRATPISQPTRLREVKISLKASPRESVAVRTGGSGGSSNYLQTFEKDPLRVGSLGSSRSKSTPPVHKPAKKSPRGKEPVQHLDRNGTLLHIPVSATHLGHSALSTSSSSSSSCTPRRPRDLRPLQQHPQTPLYTSSSSSSASSSARGMKRSRWLSYSTSNISFNSILDGRFRQLQGTCSQGGVTERPIRVRLRENKLLEVCFLGVVKRSGEASWVAMLRFTVVGECIAIEGNLALIQGSIQDRTAQWSTVHADMRLFTLTQASWQNIL